MATRLAVSLTSAARKGDLVAQLALSDCYLQGSEGLPQDYEMALAWLSRAKALGSSDAAVRMGRCIPWAYLQHHPDGVDCIRGAAELGDVRSQRTMAHLMLGGQIPALVGGQTAQEWLQKAADAGNAQARADIEFMVGGELHMRGLSRDSLDSFAGLGSTAARLELALRQWQEGSHVAAERALEKLAQAGNQMAAMELAGLLQGEGRLGDAAHYWTNLAQQGSVDAMLKLAACYMQSEGVRESGLGRSYKKAASWLLRASQSGNAEAAYALHLLYRKPGFSMRNAADSLRYLELAANRGHSNAQFSLATRILRGVCGRQARTDAAIWFARAAKQGHAMAAQRLSSMVIRAPADCSPSGPQREALKLISRKNLALAARLECGWVFGLGLLESIWVDFVRADRGELLECDLSERGCRQWPVLVLIESDLQREMLALVKRRSGLSLPGTDLSYASRTLAEAALRRYLDRCGVDAKVLNRQDDVRYKNAGQSVA